MDSKDTLNFLDLPDTPFDLRESILSKTAIHTLAKTADYIKCQYKNHEQLEIARCFFEYDLVDAAPSDGDSFIKLGLFPWVESSNELEKSLSLIMLSFYKNSYDSMRRALELIVVGAFFILDDIGIDKARSWLKSNNNTPNFRRMLEKLVKYTPYTSCQYKCQFSDYALDLYYRLSDYIHVKGIEKSQRKMKASTSRFNDVEFLEFNKKSCKESLDLFIETVQAISLICALTTPRLLVGFDLEKKFGLNPPLSGFFEYDQTERLQLLIPEKFHPFIDELEKNDDGIKAVIEWIENLPDITQEEFSTQCDEFRKKYDHTHK
ncbi:MAG: hypothetical protein AB9872_11225 [Solidesulfovibrio sp.]